MRQGPRTILVAALDVDPSIEDVEFNRWYNDEHVAERMRCPGFISATRFRSVSSPMYLAVYDLSSDQALSTPEYQSLISLPSDLQRPGVNGSEATRRIVPAMKVSMRNVYTEIYAAMGQSPEL